MTVDRGQSEAGVTSEDNIAQVENKRCERIEGQVQLYQHTTPRRLYAAAKRGLIHYVRMNVCGRLNGRCFAGGSVAEGYVAGRCGK